MGIVGYIRRRMRHMRAAFLFGSVVARSARSFQQKKNPYVAVKGKHAAHWSCAGRHVVILGKLRWEMGLHFQRKKFPYV